MTPDVSVVVPVYDTEEFVGEAVRSALDQDGCSVEVLAVDDGSTDDSRSVVASIGDPRVRILENARNQGVSAARNRALSAATGEWIQFLDSDDYLLPGKLDAQLARARDADVVYGDWREIDEITGRVRECRAAFDDAEDPVPQLLISNAFPVHAALVRRERVVKLGGFRAGIYHEDWDLWVRLAACGARFRHVDHIGVVYRRRPRSRSFDRYRSTSEELAYLRQLIDEGIEAPRGLLARLQRSKCYDLAILSYLAGDAALGARWTSSCGPLSLREEIETRVVRSRSLARLANLFPGPRRVRKWAGE